MRDIKRRRSSVQSIGHITKAFKLVSTAKLQKAKMMAEESRPFFNKMHATISSILKSSQNIQHPMLSQRESHKRAYVVITSNRGMAGGYNGNVCKLIYKDAESQGASLITIGKKGHDLLKRKGYNIIESYNHIVEAPAYEDARDIGERLLKLYEEGEIDEVYIAYTTSKSAISQEAKLLKLMPLDASSFEDETDDDKVIMNYEPDPEVVLDQIIPKYINSVIYGALKESVASEHGARMTAMDSATNNANDMIEMLSLQFNRARQASITQELSEIVGGAEALK